jgi:hypothetical protein
MTSKLRKSSYRGLSSAKFDRVPRLLPPLALEASPPEVPARRMLESVSSKATRSWYVLQFSSLGTIIC